MFYFLFYLMTKMRENQILFNSLISTFKNNVYILSGFSLRLSVWLNDFYPILTENGGKSYNIKAIFW